VFIDSAAKNDTATRVPKVSIGLAVYNGELYIREALDSLIAQCFTDFELIISDNASTDRTEAICREYAARDSRIKYVRQPVNRGPGPNFEFVLDKAVGEYFMWAAHDDVYYPNHLQELVNVHDTSDCFLVASRPEHLELKTGRRFDMLKISEGIFGNSPRSNFLAFMRLHHWDYAKACIIYGLYRRKDMASFTDIPTDNKLQGVGADLLYVYRILASGKICYLSNITWRRGERFFRDTTKPRETVFFHLKGLVRLASYWFASNFKSLDKRGVADAIDRYTAIVKNIYQDAFGEPTEDFIKATKASKHEIIKLLMPTRFWLER
jgi:glycosyltransferase involved in cell wall biosynthesis